MARVMLLLERASRGREESARLAFRCEILTDPLRFWLLFFFYLVAYI